nr:hypothetical protein [Tanacetum cinerariifolium]
MVTFSGNGFHPFRTGTLVAAFQACGYVFPLSPCLVNTSPSFTVRSVSRVVWDAGLSEVFKVRSFPFPTVFRTTDVGGLGISSDGSLMGTVVSFYGAKERYEKIERLTTPVVVPYSLTPYITASTVKNGMRNRTAHHSGGGAILAPLAFLCVCVI